MIKLIWLLWPLLIELCSVVIKKWRTCFQSFYPLYTKEFKAHETVVPTRFYVNCRIERTWPVVTDEWSWLVLGRIRQFTRLLVSDEWIVKATGRENRRLYSLMFFPYIFPHLSLDVEQWVCNINDHLVCVLCNDLNSLFWSEPCIVIYSYNKTNEMH